MKPQAFKFIFILYTFLIAMISGCINDSSVAKNRGKTTDYSLTPNTSLGCGQNQYATISQTTYLCSSTCGTGFHAANSSELSTYLATATPTITTVLKNSLGLCVSDANAIRPTNEVFISNGYCACLNGKSDIINDCDTFCAGKVKNNLPMLYVNVTLGPDIANNKFMGNLDNWCNVQLQSDSTKPQCFLSAFDENGNTIDNIPVTVAAHGNAFSADLTSLSYDRTYVVKIYEGKNGSNASSNEFQIRRHLPASSSNQTVGTLKITPISQYTCIQYGGPPDANGSITTRTTYARNYYYFPANQTPPPIPPPGSGPPSVVCHDEINNGPYDNALYPRLELIPAQTTMWDMTDSRFVKDKDTNILGINALIQSRLQTEYGVNIQKVDLFSLISIPSRPNITASSSSGSATPTNTSQGFVMSPFVNSSTNEAYCPTSTEYNGTDSMFKILKDYMGDTEGLYVGEKEPETIQLGSNSYKTVYSTMLVTETLLKKYAFYIENGLKIKANALTLHNKTIYYYWPVNNIMDPLEQGDRKLFTIRYQDELNGNTPSGVFTSIRPDDKRIGCVPKTTN